MGVWSRFMTKKFVSGTVVGVVGGAAGLWLVTKTIDRQTVFNSFTTNYEPSPCAQWDWNWDHRDPKSLVKPLKKVDDPEAQNAYNKAVELVKGRATRHLILVRHGQYNLDGATDAERTLTALGRKQATVSGKRLKALDLPYAEIVRSTMTRAQETAQIIGESLPHLKLIDCCLLEEGSPIPPEPPVGHWRPEASQFFQDGARIESAFRKYFYRADPAQKTDSYTIIVCHANVIRYFVCRALQYPAEGWLRISLGHASLTWVSIYADGRVSLRTLGDCGHMPKELLTR
ncbi:serine/threonine-protein phosphatase Pgam5, mitochondrial [Anopheles ziemanni]|uniref:serine/threonine-protein phosphatase Pgam5, mitochondrial n=1 Tax=Anopheles ziemanni TaxID=345580 RepID=UPI00265A329A|nr:serine/threonine-protein phosphatase Pgam5, mitochondrial isoform X1 [Anopheles coustani]XP_058172107.1 serine/threonine-protein phosphatase Pgam5, mitochondrial [Anopheles ziemanni]